MLIVRPGEHGPRVALVQILLNRAGAGLTVDGLFGRLTATAVIDFKKQSGISARDATVDPATWWKFPLGKNTVIADVVDVGDPDVGGEAASELQKAGGDPIQLGLMCGGVEDMIAQVIRDSGGPGTIALLRIIGHGNLGRWMTVSVGNVAHLPAPEKKLVASEDHSYIAYSNFEKLSGVLGRLAPYFAPYGAMEHGGCSLGGKPETRLLMARLADLWNVPLSVGVGIQHSILNIDGAHFTAFPKHGSLASWSAPFRQGTY